MCSKSLQLEIRNVYKTPGVRLTLGIFSFIRTPLLSGSTNQNQFVSPLLAPETVAEALAEALYSGYGDTIYMPGIGQFLAVMVMMPAPSSRISVSIYPHGRAVARECVLLQGPAARRSRLGPGPFQPPRDKNHNPGNQTKVRQGGRDIYSRLLHL